MISSHPSAARRRREPAGLALRAPRTGDPHRVPLPSRIRRVRHELRPLGRGARALQWHRKLRRDPRSERVAVRRVPERARGDVLVRAAHGAGRDDPRARRGLPAVREDLRARRGDVVHPRRDHPRAHLRAVPRHRSAGPVPVTLRPSRIVKHAFLLVGALAMIFPFYWMLTTSFKTFAEAGQFPPTLLPTAWHPENWLEAWQQPHANWATGFRNTIIVVAATTLGDLASAVLAGYAFARIRFRGRNALFVLFLATLMIPNEATLIPNYVLVSKSTRACLGLPCLGLYDSVAVQVIPFLAS